MMIHAPWNDYTNILCVRLDNLGDVLMTTPALRTLKTTFPKARLTLLSSAAGAAVARFVPELDDYLQFDTPWVKNDAVHDNAAILAMVDILRRRSFDSAILFTTYSQSALPAAMLCYLAGIHDVLGYCRENPYQLIGHWVPEREPFEFVRHEVERQLDLVATIGARRSDDTRLSLCTPDVHIHVARDKLARVGLDFARPWLILHAGASEEKRRYGLEDYAAAARQLQAEGWQIVLTGSEAERPTIVPLVRTLNKQVLDMSGELTVAELCAVIGLSSLLISNNTGPVHIAAALGTPVIVLYAQTNPQHTPWQVPHRVLYFPVPKRLRSQSPLLQDFPGPSEPQASPQAIVGAVHELAAETGGGP